MRHWIAQLRRTPAAARERVAFTLAGVAGAVAVLDVPAGVAQRGEDAAFVAPLVEIRRHIDASYVEDIPAEELQAAAVAGVFGLLRDVKGDRVSYYIPPQFERAFEDSVEGIYGGIGVLLDPVTLGDAALPPAVQMVIPGGPAEEAGVRAGDEIVAVAGEPTAGLPPGELLGRLTGEAGTDVTMTLAAGGSERAVTLVRRPVTPPPLLARAYDANSRPIWWIDEPAGLAFLRIAQFTTDTGRAFVDVVSQLNDGGGLRGLIVDLRDNGGGLLASAEQMLDVLLPAGSVLYSTEGANDPRRTVYATGQAHFTDFPIVILVDGDSASASEVFAGSLQDHGRATLVGARTYGKFSVQRTMPMVAAGGQLKLTVAYYALPSGRILHHTPDAQTWGLEPDVAIEPPATRPATRPAGEDAVYEAGVKTLRFLLEAGGS